MAQRKRGTLIAGVVVVLGAGAALAYFLTRAPQVTPRRVTRGPVVQTLVVSGRVLAPAEVELGASVVARVTEVSVDVGDRVERDQVLLALDDAEVQAQVQEAEANQRRAAAGIRQLRRVTSSVAGDELEAARVRLQDAEEELARVRTLVRSGALPRTRLEDSVRQRDLAQSALSSAATRASSTSRGGAEAALAAAQLAQAEAALVAARARLSQMSIRAPVAGVVLQRHADPGVVVSPGQALLTILADGEARLVVEPDESHLALLAEGQPALASADAFPDESFEAEVAWIAPAVDPERGTVEVRLTVADPPDYLRADMTISVDIEVGRSEDAVLVPADAVFDASTQAPYVLAIEGGRAVRRPIRLGLRGDEAFEALDGVEAGDRLVPLSATEVTDGDRVRSAGGE